jgi:hypothetical protein
LNTQEFAVTLKGTQRQRDISEAFSQSTSGNTIVNLMTLDLLVVAVGVLSHAPRRHQSVMMMIDAFLPEGITRLAVDSIFMMPHLACSPRSAPKQLPKSLRKTV